MYIFKNIQKKYSHHFFLYYAVKTESYIETDIQIEYVSVCTFHFFHSAFFQFRKTRTTNFFFQLSNSIPHNSIFIKILKLYALAPVA